MKQKVFFKITQTRLGTPIDFEGARYINGEFDERQFKKEISKEYGVIIEAVQISKISP